MIVSFPVGAFVVFDSEIGGDINHQLPITHLEIFSGGGIHYAPIDITIGDVFALFWAIYLALFTIAILGPNRGFMVELSHVIASGRYRMSKNINYMAGITSWFSILVVVSVIVTWTQDAVGIPTIPPPITNDLVQFFMISIAPLLEETGFRLILVGIPLFLLYSNRSSLRHFLSCLWRPAPLIEGNDYKKALLLVVITGTLFGFAHIALGEPWTEGKFAQATIGGIILGWVYIRYGFVVAVLVHWATNYFVYAYATITSQLGKITIQEAFEHPIMIPIEMIIIISGVLSILMLIVRDNKKTPLSDMVNTDLNHD